MSHKQKYSEIGEIVMNFAYLMDLIYQALFQIAFIRFLRTSSSNDVMISFTINAALELRVILRVTYFVKHKMPSGVQDMNLQFYINVHVCRSQSNG